MITPITTAARALEIVAASMLKLEYDDEVTFRLDYPDDAALITHVHDWGYMFEHPEDCATCPAHPYDGNGTHNGGYDHDYARTADDADEYALVSEAWQYILNRCERPA